MKGYDSIKLKFDRAVVYTFKPYKFPIDFWDSTGGPFWYSPLTHLVELYESEGTVGTMICTEKMAKCIFPHIMTGENLTAKEWMHRVYWQNRNNGFNSESNYEVGRFEFLLCDILAKRENQPLHRYLGAERDYVNAYGSGLSTHLTETQLAAEAESFLKDGYKTIKMKVAADFGADLEKDLQRIAFVRKVIGPDIGLAIDANQFFDAGKALDFINRAAEFDIEWYEEPVHCCDFGGLEELCSKSPVPVAMGESMRNHYMFEQYDKCGVKHFQPCPSNCGGITEWMQIRDLAQAHQITLTSGGLPYMSHVLIATADESAREEYLAPVEKWQREFLSVKWEEKEGRFYIPDVPGVPFRVNLERMERLGQILRKDYYYPVQTAE